LSRKSFCAISPYLEEITSTATAALRRSSWLSFGVDITETLTASTIALTPGALPTRRRRRAEGKRYFVSSNAFCTSPCRRCRIKPARAGIMDMMRDYIAITSAPAMSSVAGVAQVEVPAVPARQVQISQLTANALPQEDLSLTDVRQDGERISG